MNSNTPTPPLPHPTTHNTTRRKPPRQKTYRQTTITGKPPPNKTKRTTRRNRRKRGSIKSVLRRARNIHERRYRQASLHGKSRHDDEPYGDLDNISLRDSIRILQLNVENLQTEILPSDWNDELSNKDLLLANLIKKLRADITCLQEIGLNFNRLPIDLQWRQRMAQPLPRHHCSLAWNKTQRQDLQSPRQWGGTGIVTTSRLLPKIRKNPNLDSDPTNLGRWTSVRYMGKANHSVRVVSAYIPCSKPSASTAAGNVAQQHIDYFASVHKISVDAREQMLHDLQSQLAAWIDDGDLLVVCLDANEDVRQGPVANMFTNLGLPEAILTRHSTISPPATFNRNNKRQPIDGIFASPRLQINAAGYGPVDSFRSGHRYLWIDINIRSMLGQPIPYIYHDKARKLTSRDPRIRKRYNKIFKKLWAKKNGKSITDKYEQLISADIPSLPAIQRQWRKFNTLNTTLRRKAEKLVRKKKVGGVDWSPTMQTLRDKITLWRIVTQRQAGMAYHRRKLKILATKLRLPDAKDTTLEVATKNLDTARATYKKNKPRSSEWREQFLKAKGLAGAISEELGSTTKKIQRNLLLLEKNRRQHRMIASVIRQEQGGAADKAFHQGEELVDQSSMVTGMATEGTSRFTQSFDTPFLQEPLLSRLGIIPSAEDASAILDGTLDIPPDTDPHAAQLLRALRFPAGYSMADSLSPIITDHQHSHQWKKQREETASESKALDFVHHRAGSYDREIAHLDNLLRNGPRQFGFSPEAWEVITDFYILKRAQLYELEKMRIIQLMASAFNANNKFDGWNMMREGERRGTISKQQFGGRKNHMASRATLCKVLTMNLIMLQVLSAALISNDAKACFDRIVHFIAFLAMMRQGLAYNPLKSMFLTLQNAVHFVRTSFGVSETSYGGRAARRLLLPFHGMGQGNGIAPACWVMISTVLLDLLQATNFGAYFVTAISLSTIEYAGFAFIDDTDLFHTARHEDDAGEDIIHKVQAGLSDWNNYLKATGGALVPSKSFWYLIDFRWDGSQWRFRTIDDMPGDIHMNKVDSLEVETLRRFDCNVATKEQETLGMWIAPDGSQDGLYNQVEGKIADYTASIKTGSLSRNDSWLALVTRISKSIEYLLPVTQLTKAQWDSLLSPLLAAVLPRCGYSTKFPWAAFFSPKEWLGTGLMHFYYHQELEHLHVVMDEMNTSSFTQEILGANFDQLQIETSLPGPLTDSATLPLLDQIPRTWLGDTAKFAIKHGFTFEHDRPTIPLLREHDEFLMTLFLNAGFKGAKLRRLHDILLYFRAPRLSDITIANGKRLYSSVWDGTFIPHLTTPYRWPRRQPSLSQTHWSDWRDALTASVLLPNANLALRTQLGPWTANPIAAWLWLYDSLNNHILQRLDHDGLFRIYTTPHDGRPLGKRFSPTDEYTEDTPQHASLVSVRQLPNSSIVVVVSEGPSGHMPQPRPHDDDTSSEESLDAGDPSYNHSLEHILSRLPTSEQWAIPTCNLDCNALALANAIRLGTAVGCSDGSFSPGNGITTSGSKLCTSIDSIHDQSAVTIANQIPGTTDDGSAYRGELGGILTELIFLHYLCSFHKITEGRIILALDGQSAKEEAAGDWKPKPKRADFDILTDIKARLRLLPITVKFKWVEGHQDDSGKKLDNWALLNIYANDIAIDYRHSIPQIPLRCPRFRHERFALHHNGHKLTRFHIKKLYALIYQEGIDYWMRKIQAPNTDSINLTAVASAQSQTPLGQKRWLMKHATGHCGTGRMMLRRKHQDHDRCPCCQAPDEDTRHIILCPDIRVYTFWYTQLSKLSDWMFKNRTDNSLREKLIQCLKAWHRDGNLDTVRRAHRQDINDAIADQASLGFYNLLLGRVSVQISAIQERHLRTTTSRSTGDSWTARFIVQLWSLCRSMWEHRNAIKHDKLHPDRLREQADLVELATDLLGSASILLSPQDQHLVRTNPRAIRTWTTVQLRQWIFSVKTAQDMALVRNRQTAMRLELQQQTLQSWLGTPSPPTTDPRSRTLDAIEPILNIDFTDISSDDSSYEYSSDDDVPLHDDCSQDLSTEPPPANATELQVDSLADSLSYDCSGTDDTPLEDEQPTGFPPAAIHLRDDPLDDNSSTSNLRQTNTRSNLSPPPTSPSPGTQERLMPAQSPPRLQRFPTAARSPFLDSSSDTSSSRSDITALNLAYAAGVSSEEASSASSFSIRSRSSSE